MGFGFWGLGFRGDGVITKSTLAPAPSPSPTQVSSTSLRSPVNEKRKDQRPARRSERGQCSESCDFQVAA